MKVAASIGGVLVPEEVLEELKQYSFPDHKGRPGEVGGSLPRDEEGQTQAQVKGAVSKVGTLVERLSLGLPNKIKLISDGEDFKQSGVLGKVLTVARFKEILQERNIESAGESVWINDVWKSWKADSVSKISSILQVAAADEFNGNSNEQTLGHTVQELKESPDYQVMRSYARAQWEVTQYMMDKAGVDHLDVYRAIYIENGKEGRIQRLFPKEKTALAYTALPSLFIKQNGVASFTTDKTIANHWVAPGLPVDEYTRVVIRARVPAKAVFSLPVFGDNYTSEQEVVVLGLPWKSWDAWRGTAPSVTAFPIDSPRNKNGRFKL